MSLIEAKAVWKRTDCSVTWLMISYLLVVEQHRTQIVIHALLKCQQENLYHEQNVTFVHIPGLSYSGVKSPTECQQSLLSLILHLGNLFMIVQLHFSKLFLILKSGVNHTSRGSISTSTLPSIKLRKCSSKIITSILSFISGRLATKSNQIKQLIRNGRSASLQRTFKKSFTSFSHSTRNKTRDGLIRVRNIRALNGRFNTSITHA